MRDLINIVDSINEATLEPSQIIKYPERFDAFISHIQDGKPFYTEKDGVEVILDPSEADRFLELKAQGQFRGALKGRDVSGREWALSSFRKTAEFGGASMRPGDDSPESLKKEGALLKPSQIRIVDRPIPAGELLNEIANNQVLQGTEYGRLVIGMAQNIVAGEPVVVNKDLLKNEQIKKAVVDYAGEYLGVLALINNQTKFPRREEFIEWLGGDLSSLVLNFPSDISNPLADSFASIENPNTEHEISISSKGTGGGAPPSISSLKVPDHLREKKSLQTAIDLIELCQNENLPKPKTISQVFQVMNLLHERIPNKVPKQFEPFLPWKIDIVAKIKDSIKNGTPMPEYQTLFADLESKGSDGGKLTYVTKSAVMEMVNGGAVPEFQTAVLEILDYNFIQQYADIKRGMMVFETQWPAKLDGVVTMESKSGGTDPTKGGFSFKLKPKGSSAKSDPGPIPGTEPAVKAAAPIAVPSAVTGKRVEIRPKRNITKAPVDLGRERR
jgi:hypothetical protein